WLSIASAVVIELPPAFLLLNAARKAGLSMSQLRVVPCLQGKAPGGRNHHASLRRGSDRGTGTAPRSHAGRGGSRGHRYHEDARQGRAGARGGRGAGDRRRAGSRGGDRGGAGRRAGGDRAPDDRAGGHAQPPQAPPGVRRHQRPAAPGAPPRVIAQSNGSVYERSGGPVKTEEDPLASRPPSPSAARSLAAIKHVEKTVPPAVAEGIVLRYGGFYGPGASELLLCAVRKRQVPVIGGGTGIW